MIRDDKKNLIPKHQIWCNFNTEFGIMVGDALNKKKIVVIY